MARNEPSFSGINRQPVTSKTIHRNSSRKTCHRPHPLCFVTVRVQQNAFRTQNFERIETIDTCPLITLLKRNLMNSCKLQPTQSGYVRN